MRLSIVFAALFVLLFSFYGSGQAYASGAVPVDSARADAVSRFIDRSVTVFTLGKPLRMILVAKDIQRLFVIEHDGDTPRVVVQFVCATGENYGNKKIRGDEKTPEGVYFITKVYTDRKVTVFGRRAFHLDYPNYFDQQDKKGGDGIFIHGTNRTLRSNSTNGCVTLENHDLDQLAKYLAQDSVPIIIVPHIAVGNNGNFSITEALIGPVKAILLPNGVERERVDFDTLYIVRAAGQSVAVSEYSDTDGSIGSNKMRGYSRSYLQYNPASGWVSVQWVWHPGSRVLQTARMTKAPPRRAIPN